MLQIVQIQVTIIGGLRYHVVVQQMIEGIATKKANCKWNKKDGGLSVDLISHTGLIKKSCMQAANATKLSSSVSSCLRHPPRSHVRS